MFLSKLELNLKCDLVRKDLSDIYEMHRTIMRAFPDGTEGPGRVLFRIDGCRDACVTVLIQSDKAPDWEKLVAADSYFIRPPRTKPFDPSFSAGQQLAFRLMANPTVKRDGKRWGLVGEEEQRRWIERKASAGGFSLLRLRVTPHRSVEGEKGDAFPLTFVSVTYEGMLEVTDSQRFRATLEDGIGSGKAFGFGMLSLAPLR